MKVQNLSAHIVLFCWSIWVIGDADRPFFTNMESNQFPFMDLILKHLEHF